MQVDLAKKKISELKQAAGDPWASDTGFETGQIVEGTIVTTTDFGRSSNSSPALKAWSISELSNNASTR